MSEQKRARNRKSKMAFRDLPKITGRYTLFPRIHIRRLRIHRNVATMTVVVDVLVNPLCAFFDLLDGELNEGVDTGGSINIINVFT